MPSHRLELASDRRTALSDSERRRLRDLARRARTLAADPAQDTKLQECLAAVRELLARGSAPVVWCVFVDTAEYVAEQLRAALEAEFPDLVVECLTGRIGDEERRERVQALQQAPQRVLVATDCLSEGVNLQDAFDAVLHYDLPGTRTGWSSAKAGSTASASPDRTSPPCASTASITRSTPRWSTS